MLDCRHRRSLIKAIYQEGGSNGSKVNSFSRLIKLTKLHLDCLEMIGRRGNLEDFTLADEKDLIQEIQGALKTIRNDLVSLNMKDLNHVEIALSDYKVGLESDQTQLNIDSKKFLIKCLLSSYKKISEEIPNIQEEQIKRKGMTNLNEWKNLILQMKKNNKESPFGDYNGFDEYLDIRRNVNSLHEIYSIIDSTKGFFKQENQLTLEEKKLIFQRILHVIGENMKSTGDIPNLSDDTSRSLEEKGIPVRYLIEFRDLLAHHVLPIGEFNEYKIEELYEKGLVPIKTIVGNEIAEVREMLQEKSTKNIYEASIRKKYAKFDQAKGSERVLEISNPIAKFIHKSKLSIFGSVKGLLDKSGKKEQTAFHDDLIRTTEVEGYLLYGEAVSPDNVLDGFLDGTKVLENIKVKSEGGVSLKKSLEPYFDRKSFTEKRFYYDLPNDIKVQDLVTSLSTGLKGSSDSQKVIGFLKSISKIQDTNSNDFPLDEFKRLVEGLNIEGKEDLYKFVERWEERKDLIDLSQTNKDFTPEKLKEIVSDISNKQKALLLFANEWTEVKSFLAMLDNTKSDQGKLINFFKSIGQDIGDNYVPHDELERLVQNLSIDGDKKKKLVSFSGKLRKVGDLNSSLNDIISRSRELKRFCGYIATQRKLSRLNTNLPKGDDKGFQLIVESAQQLIKLFKSVSTSQDIVSKYIKPDDFKTLVKNLAVDDNLRQDLFSVSEKLERVKSLTNLLNTVEDSNGGKIKLMKFFKSYSQSQGNKGHYLSPNEYKNLIDNLSLNDQSKEELFLFSIEWRKNKCFSLLRSNPISIRKTYQNIIEGKINIGQIEDIKNKQVDLLKILSNPYAIEAQFVNLYSLLAPLEGNQDNPFVLRKLRNRLAHDKENKEFREELFKLIQNTKDKLSKSKVVTLSTFNNDISATLNEKSLKLPEINNLLNIKNVQSNSRSSKGELNPCASKENHRLSKRSIIECLFSKEDVEKFSKGKVDENNVDKVIIDSEKFLTYVKSSQDEAKNAQLIKFIGDKSIEGDYRYLVDRVVQEQGYERYIQNERIKDLYGDISQMDADSTKTSKLKGRLINAASGIQLIRGIHGTVVSCADGDSIDCGLSISGMAWSFASQPIENVIVKTAPKIVKSAGQFVGKMVPGTLGRQAKFAITFTGVKIGSKIAKGTAGAIGGVFDLVDIGMSANRLVDCKKRENSDNPCGEKEIRDNVASISFSGVAFISGVALTAASMPGVGVAVGFALMLGQGIYSGISNIIEYEEKYDTTHGENWDIFLHTLLLSSMPYDLEYLAARNNMVNSQAKRAWKALSDSPNDVVAYGIGFGTLIPRIGKFPAPWYAKILMNATDADTTNLSRVIPEPIQNGTMTCLPQITDQSYEKGIKKSVPTAVYYCENAMVIADERRRQNGTTILYNLERIDSGTIVGSNVLNNYFLIFAGFMQMIGGNNVVNRFLLTEDIYYPGKIVFGINATNILDLSQLRQSGDLKIMVDYFSNNGDPNCFRLVINAMEEIDYYQSGTHYRLIKGRIVKLIEGYVDSNVDTSRCRYIGRQNKTEDILCRYPIQGINAGNDGCDILIDSGGGFSKDRKDTIDNCKKVVISPHTRVTGREGDYIFYVKITGYVANDLYSEIDVKGKGTVIFTETNLLNDRNEITYSATNNTLSLKIGLIQGNQYTLDIKNYINKSSNQPNFILIDKNGSNIIPKIEKLESTIIISSFELYAEHSLDSFDNVESYYKKIINNNKDYKVFGVIRDKVQNQSNSVVSQMIFGSSGHDIINFSQGNIFARGGNGSDIYVIDSNTEKREIIIDNNSGDKMLDTLMILEVPEEFSIQQCSLHLDYTGTRIQIRNYLQDSSYRHLMVMDGKQETFIPYIQSISCVGSSEENGKLVPFFHATPTQNIFVLPKGFQGDNVVIDSRPEEIERYKDRDDLLLVREGEIPFIIKVENFYNDRGGWENVNFLLWNDGNFSPYSGLYQKVSEVMDYQDKLKNDYEKSVKEYLIDFTQSVNITHNQDDTLTLVEGGEERVGIMILKNITPDRIQVSSIGRDLVFSDKISKHVINVKNWNNSESCRISALEFDLGLESIAIRGLDRFSLSNIAAIKDLVNRALNAFKKELGCEIEIEAESGRTPLHCAAENGYLGIVKYLIEEKGVNPNVKDISGLTPLHFAAGSGSLEIVKYLVEKRGANVSVESNNEQTPLHFAAGNGHLGIVKYLIEEKGINPNATDISGLTPLHFAAGSGSLEIVKYLVEKRGVDVSAESNNNQTPLLSAAENGKLEIVRYLVEERNVDPNLKSRVKQIPLHLAAGSGSLELVKYLVEEKHADVNAKGGDKWTPLHYAAEKGNVEIIRYLVDKNADLNVRDQFGKTPLHYAAEKGNVEIIRYLVDKNADLNVRDRSGKTLLHYAAEKGNVEIIRYLVDKNADLNVRDQFDKTPLHYAAEKGNVEIIRYLVDKNADLNVRDQYNATPLHYAAEKGNVEIIRYLVDKNADLNVRDQFDKTPLHYAAEKGNVEIIRYFVDKNADLNVRDQFDKTPLHYAAEKGNVEIIRYLVDKNADLNIRDQFDKTPLDTAVSYGQRDVADLLRKVGANRRRRDVLDRVQHPLGYIARLQNSVNKLPNYVGMRENREPVASQLDEGSIIDLSKNAKNSDTRSSSFVNNFFGWVNKGADSSARPSSWINDLFNWVKGSVGGLLNSKSTLSKETSSTSSPISQVDAPIDINGTIMLLDVLIRKVTGQKYISTADQSIPLLEARGYALNITNRFEKVLNKTAIKSGISVTNLNFDPVVVQSAIIGKIINGRSSEIAKTLYSFAKEACPEFKQTDKFLDHLRSNLKEEKGTVMLQQKVEKPYKDLSQEVSRKVQLSKKPDTFLNGTSVVQGISRGIN